MLSIKGHVKVTGFVKLNQIVTNIPWNTVVIAWVDNTPTWDNWI